jgi:stearoyl-CoA desaturase (delta-9 desaturase)
LSVRDMLHLLQQRADLHLPSMPTREQLLAEAQRMFAKTMSLDEIVDRAHELLVESVCAILVIPAPMAETIPISQSNGGIRRAHPHID